METKANTNMYVKTANIIKSQKGGQGYARRVDLANTCRADWIGLSYRLLEMKHNNRM
jgi:hypothetical protein